MEQRWISVAERLPEDGTYLTTLDGELVGQEEPFTGMCGIENGKWDEDGCVIAWMPLPEPYQVGAENAHTKKLQTNADRIRSMTDEELAIHTMCPNDTGLAEIECDKSDSCNCYECLLNWLRAESEEKHGK